MAHHSQIPDFIKDVIEREKLGETGQFPQGKVHRTDEGEIRLAVGVRQGKVILTFGKPVAWIGFDSEQARDLADLLRKRADEAAS